MTSKFGYLVIIFLLCVTSLLASGNGSIEGIVLDKKTGEAIIGATVALESLNKGTGTNLDGKFKLENIPAGTYKLKVNYISYETVELSDVEVASGQVSPVNVALVESSQLLNEVVVTSVRRMNSEVSMLHSQKIALTVVSGVSSQQITRTQDRDASEVIKRIPGISIIDDKFVIARGLSQRYNNVWVNNSAVPGMEADSRSFSFDVIPSGQIENIMIVKSPSPDLPADFSGGFIKITTKNMPSENSFNVNYGMNYNTKTTFNDFKYSNGSSTDWLGFDNGFRSLNNIVPERLNNNDANQVDAVTKGGFNNNWDVHEKKAIPDQRLSLVLNRRFDTQSGKQWGLIGALNYSYTSRSYTNMENSRFGVYNVEQDKPTYLYKYTDDIYLTDSKIGGLFNLTFINNSNNRFEFRNMFNQLGRDKYTEREGYQYLSGLYNQEKTEYVYSSRSAYSGQLAGNHTFTDTNKMDWTLGFSYSNKNQPDRRILEREENGFADDPHYGEMHIDQNEIFRDFIKLNEYLYSVTMNYDRELSLGSNFKPLLKTGIYGEYRTRDYDTRAFYYRWNDGSFSSDFPYRNVVQSILIPENYGFDKLYIYEDTDNRNSYSGDDMLGAAYLAFNLPFNKFNIYTGARLEYNKMTLTNYTTIKEDLTKETNYDQLNLFPSINATYNFNKKQLMRFAYGSSINRQEFREVSSSVYYDFDLFSSIKGNPKLKPAYIQNFDLRYEFYPSPAELISLAVFYKHFKNPIEWTYLDAGGSYTYTFENAESANNVGLELDIKKSLDFIGMDNFSLLFNGSLIDSKVIFGENSMEHDRPMQGQSPYLVNAGLFYQLEKHQFNATLMYNIIGKRIVGIGKVDTSEGGSINNDVPDMYEMPRNVLDLSLSKKFGKNIELSAGIRDLLAQKVIFKQFPKFYDADGKLQTREQITKEYTPGQNISLTVKVIF